MINQICNQKLSSYAPLVLRLGLAAVVAWFGTSQLVNPNSWVNVVPAWAVDMSGMSKLTIIELNGWFEIITASLLALGVYVRWVALALSVHLFVIALSFGTSSATGIRDFGLSFALLAVFFAGQDKHCLDYKEAVLVENK